MKVGGRAIIRYVVESVLAGGVDSVWVVTGPDVEPIEAALAGLEVQIVVNPAPEEGQAGLGAHRHRRAARVGGGRR